MKNFAISLIFILAVVFFAFDQLTGDGASNSTLYTQVRKYFAQEGIEVVATTLEYGQKLSVVVKVKSTVPYHLNRVLCFPAGLRQDGPSRRIIEVNDTLLPNSTTTYESVGGATMQRFDCEVIGAPVNLRT